MGPSSSQDTTKSPEWGLPELAWVVIGLEQPHDQNSLSTHYQQNSTLIMLIKKLLAYMNCT